MTLKRLRDLLDAYGASPARWPDAERAEAIRLIAESTDANALYEAAAELDQLLDAAADTDPPSRSLTARVLGGVPIVKRGRVVTLRTTRRLAVAVPLAAAAAVAIWLAVTSRVPSEAPQVAKLPAESAPSAPQVTPATPASPSAPAAPTAESKPAAQPETIDLGSLALVEYTSATDALLSSYGVDVYTVTPSVGCGDSDLGCPKIQDSDKSESVLPTSRRPTV